MRTSDEILLDILKEVNQLSMITWINKLIDEGNEWKKQNAEQLNKPCVINRRELLVAYDNFRLMTDKTFSCSEEAIDEFLATNSL